MAFLRPHTANLTPHPAPVGPLASQSARAGANKVGWKNATVPIAERFYDIPASDFTALNVVAPLSLS